MARPEADRKLGYYPVAPEALDFILPKLAIPPAPEAIALLDPCAGEGRAIGQIAAYLGVPDKNVYCVEIEPGRAASCQEHLPGAHVVQASVFHTHVEAESCSLVYCNPPYGYLPGGGQAELAFLSQATLALAHGGTLFAVLPERLTTERGFRTALIAHYEHIVIVPLPTLHRPNYEVFVLARRRETMVNPENLHWANVQGNPRLPFGLAPAAGPGLSFARVEYDDDALWRMLEASPLDARLNAPPEPLIARPPLALGAGHMALLLSGGRLDGLVQPKGEAPHVVRGTCRKTQVLADQTQEEGAKGIVTIKSVYSERMDLIVRTVDAQGIVRTLSSGG